MALARALRAASDVALALPTYAASRRRHLWLYQSLSAALTPMFQSHSRAVPWLRDHLLGPAARVWPMPWLLGKLVAGHLIDPFADM